jgi:serine/threonine-protein kinase
MSPEQTKGLKLTPHTDFFSLGVVFFELLVGRRPFMGRTLYELMENIRYAPAPSLLTFNPKLPPSLDRIIQKALEKEPELRYRNGKEFAGDIEHVLQGKSIQVRDGNATRKADLLKPIGFFQSFSRKEIVEITRYGTFIRYDKSQVIVREGDVDTTFFILLYGRVRVIKNNRKIADLAKGACFGEMGAINKTPRTAHVIAREPCLVLKLDFKVLERESPELKVKFYHVFIETLVQRLEETTKQLARCDGSTSAAKANPEKQLEDRPAE